MGLTFAVIALKEKRPPPRRPVVGDSIPQDVGAQYFAAVVFDLAVGLKCLLRRKKVRAR